MGKILQRGTLGTAEYKKHTRDRDEHQKVSVEIRKFIEVAHRECAGHHVFLRVDKKPRRSLSQPSQESIG
jgi:hypothetical protein